MSIAGKPPEKTPSCTQVDEDMPVLQVFKANPPNPETDIALRFEALPLTIEMLNVMGKRLVQEIIDFVAEDHTGKRRVLIKNDAGREICSVLITVGKTYEHEHHRTVLSTDIWIDKIGGIYSYGARIHTTHSMACQIIERNVPLQKLIDLPDGITVPIKSWSSIPDKNLVHATFTEEYTRPHQIILTGTPSTKISSVLREFLRNNMN